MKFRRPQSLTQRHSESKPTPFSINALLNGTVIITAISWTAYLVGVVYYQTFLDRLGFNPDLFPKQASEYFIFAFYACFSSVVAALSPLLSDMAVAGAIVLFWILITLIAFLSVFFEKHRWVKAVQSKARQKRFKQISLIIIFPALGSLVTFYVLLIFAFILTVPVLLGQSAGEREAKNYLEKISVGCGVSTSCTELTESGRLIAAGIVVAASEKHVAILEKASSRSFTLEGRELIRQRQQSKP